jgi:hypothetical protein
MSIYTRSRAELSPDGKYRFVLTREWASGQGRVCFIMLNPSTADASKDDATIRKCVGFARKWGFAALDVVNLFALRTKHPSDLRCAPDLVGPRDQAERLYSDIWLTHAAAMADKCVAAWGNDGSLYGRDRVVLKLLKGLPLFCLSVTEKGQPGHPLYIPYHTPLLPFASAEQPKEVARAG